MSAAPIDTQVTQYLTKRGLPFRRIPHTQPIHTCEAAATERHLPLEEVIKCLVFVDGRHHRPVMACFPASEKLSYGKLRKALDTRKLKFASEAEIGQVTGYEKGAVPPIALPEDLKVVGESSILDRVKVNFSSGDHWLGIEMSIADFKSVFQGTFANVVE